MSEIPSEQAKIIGIRFQPAGKIYFYTSGNLDLHIDDYVVVETPSGNDIARVVIIPEQVIANEISEPLKCIVRKTDITDINGIKELENKEEQVLGKCRTIIKESKELSDAQMKPLKAKYNLDGSHLTIYFRAENRIDFRNLVRELASTFKTKVELRQVGPRDEAKILGGFGICGFPLCCTTFLTSFNPLSIKMAKEQNLPLNPTKISGACGRLLCCLRYEDDFYREINNKLPQIEQQIQTPQGVAEVVEVHPLKEMVTVKLEDTTLAQFKLSEITIGDNKPAKSRKQHRRK